MWCTKSRSDKKDLSPLQIGLGRRRRLVAVRYCALHMAVRRDGKSEQLIKNKCNVLGSLNSFRLHVIKTFLLFQLLCSIKTKLRSMNSRWGKQEKYRFSILTCFSLKIWRNLICIMKSPDLKSALTFVRFKLQSNYTYIITLSYLLCSTNLMVPAS